MEKNTELLSKALRLLPEVKNTVVHPNEGQEYSKPLGKGDSVRIDFGRHLVGHLKLKLGYTDSHPDAPVWLKFSFAENLKEFDEDVENYNGWICSAWHNLSVIQLQLLQITKHKFLSTKQAFLMLSHIHFCHLWFQILYHEQKSNFLLTEKY